MSVDAFRRAYADDRIGRAWGFRSSDYAGGRHRGLDVREVHESGGCSIVTDVVAISDGVVDYVGRPNSLLGPTVRIRRADGGYEFHSHTVPAVTVGTRTTPGTVLGRNAALNERPGQISGVHDHIVFSDHADGAWNTSRETYDPLPFIRNAAAGLAGTGSRPLNPQEDTMLKNDPDLQERLNQIVDYLSQNFTGLTNVVTAEGGTTREFVDRRVSELAGWTRDDANATRAALAELTVAGTDPVRLAEALAPLIPRGADPAAVVDELRRRLDS